MIEVESYMGEAGAGAGSGWASALIGLLQS